MLPGDIICFIEDDKRIADSLRAFKSAALASNRLSSDAIEHVAIALDATRVLESDGEKLTVTDLTEEASPRSALVWSGLERELADSAAYVAEHLLRHTVSQAPTLFSHAFPLYREMIKALFDTWLAIDNHALASQTILTAYEVGNLHGNAFMPSVLPEPVFKQRPSRITPGELIAHCDGSPFYLAGFWRNGLEVRL